MARNQRSVQREGSLRGVALHSGAEVEVRIRPAPADAGVVFVRTDLPGSPRIPADAAHLSTRERRTALVGERGAEVHTVEHLLACCTGLGIDNLEVSVSAAELPGMDGSAKPFADLLLSLGPVDLKVARREIVVDEPVAVAAGQDISLVAFPDDRGFKVSYTLDYRPHPFLGVQHVSFAIDAETFLRDIAPARTFVLESEAAALREKGLGQGATPQNTLIVGVAGVVDNVPRWPDEFARHKVLDLLGDLFLAGADLVGHVHAHRTGHAANLKLVERIVEAVRQREVEGRLQRPSGLDHMQIRRILPHRYPMLMVARVIEIHGFQRAVGEPFELRPVEFTLLALLQANGRASAKQIGSALRLPAPHVTTLVDRLAERGLVDRGRDPHDGRAVRIVLTGAGAELSRRLRGVAATMEDELLAALEPDEQATLRRLLRKLTPAGTA